MQKAGNSSADLDLLNGTSELGINFQPLRRFFQIIKQGKAQYERRARDGQREIEKEKR
jgi:hypothetical protein